MLGGLTEEIPLKQGRLIMDGILGIFPFAVMIVVLLVLLVLIVLYYVFLVYPDYGDQCDDYLGNL